MEKKKEKADQNTVAKLTREGLYKENKWLMEENRKLREENERLKIELEDRMNGAINTLREVPED